MTVEQRTIAHLLDEIEGLENALNARIDKGAKVQTPLEAAKELIKDGIDMVIGAGHIVDIKEITYTVCNGHSHNTVQILDFEQLKDGGAE